jgi:hypothetical protein
MSDEPGCEEAEAFRREPGEDNARAVVCRRIAQTAPESAMLTQLAQLQRTAGNAAVGRLLTPPAAE